MKTNSRFSQNGYAIRDIIWCNKHLRHTTTGKYDNNGLVVLNKVLGNLNLNFYHFSTLNGSGIWNSSLCKAMVRFNCIGNDRVVGDLAMHGARISSSMVSTYFTRNISISAPDKVTLWRAYWRNISNTLLQSCPLLTLLIWSVVDITCFTYYYAF